MVKNKLKSLRYVEWATGIIILSVVSLLVIASNTHKNPTIHNATGVNEQVNYQGRLLTNTGAVVPDGTYNMEFKIYQDGNGVLGGGDETLEWTETRTSGNKVTVKNGYFSVYLGAVTAFGSNIDWNQDTLWLSINIGGTGSPSWDGEMSPFSRFSSSPYALNSKALNGLASGDFVQLAQGTQTDSSSTNASISINKTAGTANLLELLRGGANVVTVSNSGATTFQNQTNSTAAFQIQNVAGDQLLKIDTATTENLITNGQFETNTTGWAAHGSAGSPSQSTSQHYLGNGSMQFTTTAAANDGVKYNYALASQTTYTMTFYVKNSTNIAAVSTISLGRSEDGSTDSDCAVSQTISGAGWTKLTCTFTTANVTGTDYIYLKQSDAVARTIYIDSAQLQTTSNLVINPDFETDISNWNSYGGPTTTHNTSESYTGSGSMQIDTNGFGASEGPSLTSFAGTITANTTYTASFWVKTDAATASAKTFSILKRFDSTDAGAGTTCGNKSVPIATWTNVSCTFTTGNTIPNGSFISLNVTDDGITPITFFVDTVNLSMTKYNSNDIGRISLNAAIDSPLTVRGAQDSTSALQVQQLSGKTVLNVDTLNGFVGIGTDAATKTLQVDGKALFRATSSDTDTFQITNSAAIGTANSVIFNVAANSRAVSVGTFTNTLNANLNVYGTQLINTKTNNANAFRITDASGIGALTFSTTSGNRKLQIGGTGTGNDGKFAVSNSNGDTVFDLDSSSTGSVQFYSDYFDIFTTTGNQLYFDSSLFSVGGVSGATSYNDSTGIFEVSDGSGATGLYYDIPSSRLGLGTNYNTPGYTLDVGGDINVGSGSVYRVAGTAGSTTTCSGGQFLQNQVVVGGITTGGTCVAGGGGGVTTVGTFSGSSIANGASISGSTITFGPADGTNPGMVTTGSQTFAGAKTFNAAIAANGGITFDNSTDTIGAFTNGGTQDANANLIVNIGNAGTDFTSGGGLTLAGNLIANGDTTLGDAATDGLTFTGEIRNASALTFEGATNNNIYTIFSITDPTSSNKTITFADATGTVLLHSMISSDATVTSAGVLTIAANAIGASEVTDGTLTTSDLAASAGILNAQLANSGLTVTAGNGLITGGAVSLGGTVTLDIGAGNGITVNANDIAVDLTVATDALSATTSSGSGLEVLASGVTLLQGCADNQVLRWGETSDVWSCSTTDLDMAYDIDSDKELLVDSSTGLIFDLTTTGDFVIQDSNTTFATFSNTGGINFTPTGSSDIVFTLDDDSNLIINDGITNTGSIFDINTTLGDDADADTVSALNIDVTSATTGDADILSAINIGNLASAGATVREEAVSIGTGWDDEIALNDTTPTVRLGATDGTAVFHITDSCSSSCVNGGTGPNSLFEIRDIGTNFGGLVSSGGFLGTNSYMSQEFAADIAAASTADSATVGDNGTWYADLSTAASTENWSQTDQVGGFVRMTNGVTSGRGILLGFGAAQNNLSLGFAKANLPVLQMKVRTSVNNATNDLFWGFMDQATAPIANDTKPANGIYFWNNNAAGAWQGVVRSGAADVGTVTCSGSVSTTQFAVGRIQVESATSVRFLIDNDASNGVEMTDCGTVSGANPAASLGVAAYTVHTETTGRTFDVDYVRVWQDDVADATEVASDSEDQNGTNSSEGNSEDANINEVQTSDQNFTAENINAQTVTIDQSLFVNGDTTLAGALTVQSGAIFNGEAIFNKLATFVDKVLFQKDVTFAGRTSFNSDTGGYAKISAGQTQVKVTFDEPYAQPPVVTLTVKNGQFVQYAYTDLTPEGFTIILSQPATADVEFSWTALQINGAKVASN